MVAHATMLIASVAMLCHVSRASMLRSTADKPTTADPDCPYGYGDGCDAFWEDAAQPDKPSNDGKIDDATKKKVGDILSGIISSLSSKPVPRLVEIKGAVVRSDKALASTSAVDVKRVLGSFLSALQRRSGSGSAKLLSSLSGSKVDDESASAVAGVLAETLDADADICPFGFGCGGGGDIDPATKAQVANILSGIIKNLSSHKSLAQVNLGTKKALGSLLATLRSSHSAKGAAVAAGLVGAKVDAKALAAQLGQMLKAEDCPFGYGCGGGGSISPATKAQVANILSGIIKNLSSHRK